MQEAKMLRHRGNRIFLGDWDPCGRVLLIFATRDEDQKSLDTPGVRTPRPVTPDFGFERRVRSEGAGDLDR